MWQQVLLSSRRGQAAPWLAGRHLGWLGALRTSHKLRASPASSSKMTRAPVALSEYDYYEDDYYEDASFPPGRARPQRDIWGRSVSESGTSTSEGTSQPLTSGAVAAHVLREEAAQRKLRQAAIRKAAEASTRGTSYPPPLDDEARPLPPPPPPPPRRSRSRTSTNPPVDPSDDGSRVSGKSGRARRSDSGRRPSRRAEKDSLFAQMSIFFDGSLQSGPNALKAGSGQLERVLGSSAQTSGEVAGAYTRATKEVVARVSPTEAGVQQLQSSPRGFLQKLSFGLQDAAEAAAGVGKSVQATAAAAVPSTAAVDDAVGKSVGGPEFLVHEMASAKLPGTLVSEVSSGVQGAGNLSKKAGQSLQGVARVDQLPSVASVVSEAGQKLQGAAGLDKLQGVASEAGQKLQGVARLDKLASEAGQKLQGAAGLDKLQGVASEAGQTLQDVARLDKLPTAASEAGQKLQGAAGLEKLQGIASEAGQSLAPDTLLRKMSFGMLGRRKSKSPPPEAAAAPSASEASSSFGLTASEASSSFARRSRKKSKSPPPEIAAAPSMSEASSSSFELTSSEASSSFARRSRKKSNTSPPPEIAAAPSMSEATSSFARRSRKKSKSPPPEVAAAPSASEASSSQESTPSSSAAHESTLDKIRASAAQLPDFSRWKLRDAPKTLIRKLSFGQRQGSVGAGKNAGKGLFDTLPPSDLFAPVAPFDEPKAQDRGRTDDRWKTPYDDDALQNDEYYSDEYSAATLFDDMSRPHSPEQAAFTSVYIRGAQEAAKPSVDSDPRRNQHRWLDREMSAETPEDSPHVPVAEDVIRGESPSETPDHRSFLDARAVFTNPKPMLDAAAGFANRANPKQAIDAAAGFAKQVETSESGQQLQAAPGELIRKLSFSFKNVAGAGHRAGESVVESSFGVSKEAGSQLHGASLGVTQQAGQQLQATPSRLHRSLSFAGDAAKSAVTSSKAAGEQLQASEASKQLQAAPKLIRKMSFGIRDAADRSTKAGESVVDASCSSVVGVSKEAGQQLNEVTKEAGQQLHEASVGVTKEAGQQLRATPARLYRSLSFAKDHVQSGLVETGERLQTSDASQHLQAAPSALIGTVKETGGQIQVQIGKVKNTGEQFGAQASEASLQLQAAPIALFGSVKKTGEQLQASDDFQQLQGAPVALLGRVRQTGGHIGTQATEAAQQAPGALLGGLKQTGEQLKASETSQQLLSTPGALIGKVKETGEQIQAQTSDASEQLKATFGKVNQTGEQLQASEPVQQLQSAPSALFGTVMKAGGHIRAQAAEASQQGVSTIQAAPGSLFEKVKETGEKMQTSETAQQLQSAPGALFGKVKESGEQLQGSETSQQLQSAPGELFGKMSSKVQDAAGAGESMASKMSSGVQHVSGHVSGTGESMVGASVEWTKEAGQQLHQVTLDWTREATQQLRAAPQALLEKMSSGLQGAAGARDLLTDKAAEAKELPAAAGSMVRASFVATKQAGEQLPIQPQEVIRAMSFGMHVAGVTGVSIADRSVELAKQAGEPIRNAPEQLVRQVRGMIALDSIAEEDDGYDENYPRVSMASLRAFFQGMPTKAKRRTNASEAAAQWPPEPPPRRSPKKDDSWLEDYREQHQVTPPKGDGEALLVSEDEEGPASPNFAPAPASEIPVAEPERKAKSAPAGPSKWRRLVRDDSWRVSTETFEGASPGRRPSVRPSGLLDKLAAVAVEDAQQEADEEKAAMEAADKVRADAEARYWRRKAEREARLASMAALKLKNLATSSRAAATPAPAEVAPAPEETASAAVEAALAPEAAISAVEAAPATEEAVAALEEAAAAPEEAVAPEEAASDLSSTHEEPQVAATASSTLESNDVAGDWPHSHGGGVLRVHLSRAANLYAADKGGTSDPYFKLLLGSMVEKTPVVKKTLNPTFDQYFTFRFDNLEAVLCEKLRAEAYDYDFGSLNDSLGFAVAELAPYQRALDIGDKVELALSLSEEAGIFKSAAKAKSKGMAYLTISWEPDKRRRTSPPGAVKVQLRRATNLRSGDKAGTSDPFVKLSLGSRTEKSTVVKKSLNPVWGEGELAAIFTFPYYDLQAACEESLELEAFDWDEISFNDSLGAGVASLAALGAGEQLELSVQLADKRKLAAPNTGVVHVAVSWELDLPKPLSSVADDIEEAEDLKVAHERADLEEAEADREDAFLKQEKEPAWLTRAYSSVVLDHHGLMPIADEDDDEVPADPYADKITAHASSLTNPMNASEPPELMVVPPPASLPKPQPKPAVTDGVLRVHISRVSNLKVMDKGGTSDPYVKLLLDTFVEKTPVAKKTLNPTFDQDFTFRFRHIRDMVRLRLLVEVYDHDVGSIRNDSLGNAEIELTQHQAALSRYEKVRARTAVTLRAARPHHPRSS